MNYLKKKINLFGFIFFISSLLILIPTNKKNKKNDKLIGISFGPTGGLFAYSLGISKYLQEKFILNNLIFAGISGGVQSCIILSLDIPVDIAFNNWLIPLVKEIEGNFFLNIIPPWNMLDISRKYLGKSLEPYDLSKLNGKFYAGITKIFPYPHNYSECYWKNDFNDLYNGLQASQYIPFISGYPTCFFRKCMCIDGYLTKKRFEPINGKWIHINPFKWTKKNAICGIMAISNVGDINFHLNQYKIGYNDAKKNHNYFIERGLIEK